MKRIFLLGILILIVLENINATIRNVSSISQLNSTLNAGSTVAGDIIVLANNTYSNANITISKSSITVRAATSGGVILNGSSDLTINGSSVTFSGFQFKNGDVGTNNIVEIYGNNNIITQCNFYGVVAHNYVHVREGAYDNQLTYCNFEAKPGTMNAGPSIQVTTSATVVSATKIRYCTFMNFLGLGGDFGNESIRIGLSVEGTNTSGSVVEYCYFENTGPGDSEAISLKSTGNVVRYNTNNNNPAAQFVCRHGSRSSVYGNFFINSGGVRIKEGSLYSIYNNYFYLASTATVTTNALELMNYDVDPLDYIYVYHNTFYTPYNLTFGASTSAADLAYVPQHVYFANNIIYKTGTKIIKDVNPNVTYTSNLYFGGASLGLSGTTTAQFNQIDPKLTLNSNNFYGLSATSPAINTGNSTPPALYDNPNVDDDPTILLDIKGQTRSGIKDIGCDEYTTGTITNYPLTRYQAGPTYLNPVVLAEMISFSAAKKGAVNQVLWQTASEINNKGYDVERAGNDQNFQSIGFVQGKGKPAMYEFLDEHPFPISYYRLRQMDNDGKETYSKIVSVTQKEKETFRVFPNPASEKLFILNDTEGGLFSINDVTGRLVMAIHETDMAKGINISALAKGIYFIQWRDKTQFTINQKFIKN